MIAPAIGPAIADTIDGTVVIKAFSACLSTFAPDLYTMSAICPINPLDETSPFGTFARI